MKWNFGIVAAFAVSVGLGFAATGPAKADLFMTVPEAGVAYLQYGNDGFVFTPTTDLLVTALDYYASPYDSYCLSDPHEVGIYDATDQTLLVSTTIGPGCGPLVGGTAGDSYFLSVPVSATLLLPGQQYMLAGYSQPNEYENGGSDGSGIPLGSLVLFDATLDGYYYDYSGSLDYPTTPYGTAFVGPDFEASAVPEPLTLSLFGAGLIGLGALRRRKARKAA